MKPEDVPEDVVMEALQASEAMLNGAFDKAEQMVLFNWMRKSLALVWDNIYSRGFAEGFSTKISMEKEEAREAVEEAQEEG